MELIERAPWSIVVAITFDGLYLGGRFYFSFAVIFFPIDLFQMKTPYASHMLTVKQLKMTKVGQ